jgi:2-dehydropantoate 2-reductase
VGARSYTVIGLGAIGGFYGARLAAAGHPVRFVTRSGVDEVRASGLHVESPLGDVSLADVDVHDTDAARRGEVDASDVVVVSVKTTDTADALTLLPALVHERSTIVVMQNGLGVEEPIADAVPDHEVVGAMCFICSNRVAPGHIRHLDYGRVTLAHHRRDGGPAGSTPEVEAVVDDLAAAGVTAAALDHLAAARWHKLVWNVPYNGLSVVLDAGTDELMADRSTRRLVEDIMWEVVAGSAACGAPIESEFVGQMLDDTDNMSPYATSMKLDYEAGRPLELDAIYDAPIRAAAASGCRMVRTAALHDQLRFLDARSRAVRVPAGAGRGTSRATPS